MIQPGNNFFNEYCQLFQGIAKESLNMDWFEIMASIDDLPEIAKRVPFDDYVFILVVPDFASIGPNNDQLRDGVSCAFFFLTKMNPKNRLVELQSAMNNTMELALNFRKESQKITNTCSWIERLDWTGMTLSPFFNLSELYGWGMELKLQI